MKKWIAWALCLVMLSSSLAGTGLQVSAETPDVGTVRFTHQNVVGSQTCYVPQLWLMPDSGHYEKRERGTVSQDLWDAVILNREKRELYLCRFGVGDDGVIHY